MINLRLACGVLLALALATSVAPVRADSIEPLKSKGPDFVDSSGRR